MSLRILLTDEQKEKMLGRLSADKMNSVFKTLWNPKPGEIEDDFHGDNKTFRYISEESEKVYLSRYCIAEKIGWKRDDYASEYAQKLTKNLNALEKDKLGFYLLDKENGLRGTKCWRVSKKKVADSLISAIEKYHFELQPEEERTVRKIVEIRDEPPKPLTEVRKGVCYNLVHDYFWHLLKGEKTADDLFHSEDIEEREALRQILEKFREELKPLTSYETVNYEVEIHSVDGSSERLKF